APVPELPPGALLGVLHRHHLLLAPGSLSPARQHHADSRQKPRYDRRRAEEQPAQSGIRARAVPGARAPARPNPEAASRPEFPHAQAKAQAADRPGPGAGSRAGGKMIDEPERPEKQPKSGGEMRENAIPTGKLARTSVAGVTAARIGAKRLTLQAKRPFLS